MSVLLSVRVCCNFMHIFGGHANRANAVQSGVKSKVVGSKCPPQVIVKQVRVAVEFFFCSRADVNLIRYFPLFPNFLHLCRASCHGRSYFPRRPHIPWPFPSFFGLPCTLWSCLSAQLAPPTKGVGAWLRHGSLATELTHRSNR